MNSTLGVVLDHSEVWIIFGETLVSVTDLEKAGLSNTSLTGFFSIVPYVAAGPIYSQFLAGASAWNGNE